MKYYIGIDIGGTTIKAGIVDENGNILVKDAVKTDARQERLAPDAAALAEQLLIQAGLEKENITGVGMGIPGTVDAKNGIVRYSNNIAISDLPIAAQFRALFDRPIEIGNDADAAALGELYFGSARGMQNVVFVTLGTGVGTGIIINGKLLTGSEGGHLCIRTDGVQCTCGRHGCWEAYASVTALKRQTHAAFIRRQSPMTAAVSRKDITGRTAFDCARAGDEIAAAVVERYLGYVAEGIADLVNVFHPECVLIGGGLSNEEPKYFERIAALANAEVFGHERLTPTPIRAAALKNDAGLLGAAGLAIAAE